MANFSYVKSQRGGVLLQYNNFLFSCRKKSKNKNYWRCTSTNCRATLITETDVLKKINGNHNHESHESKIVKKKISEELKKVHFEMIGNVFSIVFQGF